MNLAYGLNQYSFTFDGIHRSSCPLILAHDLNRYLFVFDDIYRRSHLIFEARSCKGQRLSAYVGGWARKVDLTISSFCRSDVTSQWSYPLAASSSFICSIAISCIIVGFVWIT